MTKKPVRLIYPVFQIFLSLIGTLLSFYLLAKHYLLKFGIQDGASFCAIGDRFDCDAVSLSPFASIFGVPNALIGTLFYFVLFILALVSDPKSERNAWVQRVFAYFCALGLLLDLYLLGVQVFILKSFCLLCLLSYAITAGLLYLAYQMLPPARSKFATLFTSPVGKMPSFNFSTRALAATAFISFTAVIICLPMMLKSQSQTHQMVENAMENFFSKWHEIPGRRIDLPSGTPFYGNPNAKVEIVEFSDFQCPFCKKSAFTLHHFMMQNKHRVKFYFKHYPLDSDCNSSVEMRMHPLACDLAKASLCAERKGKFWQFHDKAFFSLSEDKARTIASVSSLVQEGFFSGLLDDQEYAACLRDANITKEVKADIQMGQKLGIKGTPALFINGKPFTIPITIENLNRVLALEE